MTYEIKYEPDIIEGVICPQYNIYYTSGPYDGMKERHSTDGVSGTVREGYVKISAPNWLSLEQTLRYFNESSLFSKAFTNATDKGFGLFLATLANGKRGDASEGALSFAFSVLGVTWTEQEKSQINQILLDNNFSIQIQ